jgi:hypothetical protein
MPKRLSLTAHRRHNQHHLPHQGQPSVPFSVMSAPTALLVRTPHGQLGATVPDKDGHRDRMHGNAPLKAQTNLERPVARELEEFMCRRVVASGGGARRLRRGLEMKRRQLDLETRNGPAQDPSEVPPTPRF